MRWLVFAVSGVHPEVLTFLLGVCVGLVDLSITRIFLVQPLFCLSELLLSLSIGFTLLVLVSSSFCWMVSLTFLIQVSDCSDLLIALNDRIFIYPSHMTGIESPFKNGCYSLVLMLFISVIGRNFLL